MPMKMELINQLEIYINAQKAVGFNAFVFSSAMIIAALLLYIYGASSLATGLRNGTFIIGLVLILMGIGLRISQENILKEKKLLYQKDPVEFKQLEIERMTKVKNNYPKGQMVMTGLVVLSLVAFLLIKSGVWQGICLSFTIFFVGNIIIEAFSYLSIFAYFQILTS